MCRRTRAYAVHRARARLIDYPVRYTTQLVFGLREICVAVCVAKLYALENYLDL